LQTVGVMPDEATLLLGGNMTRVVGQTWILAAD
jgi:hypothetical protein